MQLTTDRLTLREFSPDDVPAVLAYQGDPRYFRYYEWTDRTEADVRDFLQMFFDWRDEEPRRKFQFAITLSEGGRLIGSAGIRRKPENEWEADIGYEVAAEHWGNAYATEASRALVEFGFRELKLHRISAGCVAENTASVHVLERLGFSLEGHLRESAYFKDRWWDARLYALLEDEWRSNAQIS